MEKEVTKETIQSKSGVLKRTKKPTKKPTDSPIQQHIQDPTFESFEPQNVDSSNPASFQKGIKKIWKPQFNRKGLLFRVVYVPISHASKKRQATDMAQKLNKNKRKHQDPLDNVIVKTDHDSDSGRSDGRIEDFVLGSPRRDSPLKLNFEATGDPDFNVNITNTDTRINSNDESLTSILEKTLVVPPRVSHTESNMEEVQTPYILVDLSDKHTNVIMGEGVQNNECFLLPLKLQPSSHLQ